MSAPSTEHVVVPQRFRGPPGSGNGGYVAGLVAALVQGSSPADDRAVEVSLLAPPPLQTPLDVRRTDTGVEVGPDGSPIARARAVPDDLAAIDPVDLAVAAAATSGFPGHSYHPFPSCFGCGTGRVDGLQVFPGPIEASDDGLPRVAATWTPATDLAAAEHERQLHADDDPTPRAAPAITWAALDCIGGWSTDLGDRLAVLGRMTAVLDTLPVIGEPHVVIGQSAGGDGRKSFATTTLYDSDGRIVARARQVWLGVDPSTFGIAPQVSGKQP